MQPELLLSILFFCIDHDLKVDKMHLNARCLAFFCIVCLWPGTNVIVNLYLAHAYNRTHEQPFLQGGYKGNYLLDI